MTRHPGSEGVIHLRDGRSAAVRPTRPEDEQLLRQAAEGMELGMLVTAAENGGSAGLASRLAAAEGAEGFGLIAIAGDPERAIAVARVDRSPGADEGEMLIAVERGWRGVGVGTSMVELLVERGAAAGVEGLVARVRPEREGLAEIAQALGAETDRRPEGDHVVLRLSTKATAALARARTERFREAAAASLEPLFRPGAIAVVGASRRAEAPGGAAFRAILAAGFPGPVYGVSRSGGEIDGQPLYPSLADCPGPVDLVVVAVPAPAVPAVARDAVAVGARALVVISSGFSEVGPEGAELESELLHIANTGGLRVLGPNCLGLAVTDPERPFDATFGPERPPQGRIAFASQSGGLGIGALAFCARNGIGLSAFASLGNKADISSNDLLAWWGHDEQTRVVLLYLEGFGNPRRFVRLARSVARTTPIVALKSGRSAAGQRAAGSHTAALAAGDAPTDALFRLAGVVRVDTVSELFEAGLALSGQPLPQGERISIVSNAGGPAILAADACEGRGLSVPPFDDALQEQVRGSAPAVAGPANPVDLGAGAGPEAYTASIEAIRAAGVCDAILAIHTPTRGGDWRGVLAAVQAQAGDGLPIIGCLLGEDPPPPAHGEEWPVPWLAFPEGAVRALDHCVSAGRASRRTPDPAEPVSGIDTSAGRLVLADVPEGQWLDSDATEALLSAYGLRLARSRVARTADEAAAAQAEIGGKVAVKLLSDVITHKTDVGGVVLGCASPPAAAAAYGAIEARIESACYRGAFQGVLVQEQVPAGLDLIVGAVTDPVFGPLILAGLGGVQAELWGDRSVALAPLGARAAAHLWSGLRGAPLLDGYRGAPAADRAALEDVVLRVGRLAAEQPLLAEMDLNPVRALEPGSGAVVLDARIRRA